MTVDTYKILGQLSNPTAGAQTNLYTAPSPGGAITSSLWVCNRNATDALVSVYVLIGGSATVLNPFVRYSTLVPANGFIRISDGYCLGPGDKLQVSCNTANMDVTLFGDEQSSLGKLAPKCLGMVSPAATTDTTLYTVPSAHSAIVRAISMANFGSVRLARARIDKAASTQTYLAFDVSVPALQFPMTPGAGDPNLILDAGITLAAGDVITVRNDNANVTWACWGLEVG